MEMFLIQKTLVIIEFRLDKENELAGFAKVKLLDFVNVKVASIAFSPSEYSSTISLFVL